MRSVTAMVLPPLSDEQEREVRRMVDLGLAVDEETARVIVRNTPCRPSEEEAELDGGRSHIRRSGDPVRRQG